MQIPSGGSTMLHSSPIAHSVEVLQTGKHFAALVGPGMSTQRRSSAQVLAAAHGSPCTGRQS